MATVTDAIIINGIELHHTICRCCGGKLDAFYQMSCTGGQGYLQVTCWQKGCGMEGVTWDDLTYGELDLTLYGASERK